MMGFKIIWNDMRFHCYDMRIPCNGMVWNPKWYLIIFYYILCNKHRSFAFVIQMPLQKSYWPPGLLQVLSNNTGILNQFVKVNVLNFITMYVINIIIGIPFPYHSLYQPPTNIIPRVFGPRTDIGVSGWYGLWYGLLFSINVL